MIASSRRAVQAGQSSGSGRALDLVDRRCVSHSGQTVAVYTPVLTPIGVAHPQYVVTLALWERSPRALRDIADALWLESATLRPLLQRLGTAGIAERPPGSDDERALAVSELEAVRDSLTTLRDATRT